MARPGKPSVPFPAEVALRGGSAGYQFTSVQDGFEIAGDSFGAAVYATHDGGHSWKPVYECTATLQVNGLTRATNCVLNDLRFVSRQVAYAVGGGENWAAIAKTTDGGSTWKLIYAATDVPRASTVFFTDENNGVVRLWDSRVLSPLTVDRIGEATGIAEATTQLADPEVGLLRHRHTPRVALFRRMVGRAGPHRIQLPGGHQRLQLPST